jgi:hypothetical protein
MSKFVIEPHFRLQEWVAEEKGNFRAAGLDYEFKELIRSTDGAHHETVGKSRAFQSIEKGRTSDVTCACGGGFQGQLSAPALSHAAPAGPCRCQGNDNAAHRVNAARHAGGRGSP